MQIVLEQLLLLARFKSLKTSMRIIHTIKAKCENTENSENYSLRSCLSKTKLTVYFYVVSRFSKHFIWYFQVNRVSGSVLCGWYLCAQAFTNLEGKSHQLLPYLLNQPSSFSTKSTKLQKEEKIKKNTLKVELSCLLVAPSLKHTQTHIHTDPHVQAVQTFTNLTVMQISCTTFLALYYSSQLTSVGSL